MAFQSQPVKSSPEHSAQITSRLPGKVVFPSDAGYDTARFAWNAAVDQRPAVVIFAESALDVIEAVTYAHNNHLPLAVQSTGHGVLQNADNAVLINVSRMQGLLVDPETQTAWIEAGVKWGRVLEQAQQYGLAPLLGSSPDVGAVGYTLGGGMGWLCRKFGLSIDSVLSMDVVTPDGILRRASAEENQDLFWALRGGGGGFGVVISMEIRLHPVSKVYAGNLLYPPELAQEVFARFARWAEDAPDELTASISVMNYPPVPELPEFLRGKSFVIVRGCYAGPVEEGEKLLDYWREWLPPTVDDFKTIPFARAAEISQDPVDPMPNIFTGGWLRDLGRETAKALIDYTLPQGGPPPLVFTEVRLAGGAVSRVDPDACAYSNRSERLIWVSLGVPMAPEMAPMIEMHLQQMHAALGDSLTGKAYMNFLGGEEAQRRTHEGYSAESLRRLREIKAKYDPDYRMSYGYDLRK